MFFEYFEKKRKINKTIRELKNLSDRDLNDIGISRYDIVNVARNGR